MSSFLTAGNVYFKEYSDDVGILTDSSCVLDDSIVPWYDIFNDRTRFSEIFGIIFF